MRKCKGVSDLQQILAIIKEKSILKTCLGMIRHLARYVSHVMLRDKAVTCNSLYQPADQEMK